MNKLFAIVIAAVMLLTSVAGAQDILIGHYGSLTGSEATFGQSTSNGLKNVGFFLCDPIKEHFARAKVLVDVKYLDPTYHIRSAPAGSQDALFCDQLARHAVHAAMAGKTDALIGT